MKFSESWLREWINPEISSKMLADQLTMAGLEVDDMEKVAGDFTGVVIGKVVECTQHPNADKLRVTKVDIGKDELLDIVCGAPNCRQGLMVACATVGAVLPGDFRIKSAKLRGEPSEGMLCSYSELGIADDHNGIIELPNNAPLGEDIREYLNLNDVMIDISVTPNRADCFGIVGVARDISAVNNIPMKELKVEKVPASISDTVSIQIDVPKAAPRYLGRVIKNINIHATTPLWMKEKLRRGGIRSVDAVVDITNYVLLELGHPMHAFDLDQIEKGIIVRYAHQDEEITLLNGNEVKLNDKTLVIADHNKVLAIAGIMGGEKSSVIQSTKNIFLESAYFAPLAIAGKAREYGLHTEASHRYERGVDPELQFVAMERATQLLVDICKGEVGPVIEVTNQSGLPSQATIKLRRNRIDRIIGYTIETQKITDILVRLGCEVDYQDDIWIVKSPSWRFDLQIEEDLVEEVARVYGYNNIPNANMKIESVMQPKPESNISLRRIKELLVDRGYQEAVTYSFVDPKIQHILHPNETAITLPNPISSEMSAMRLSLWSGLLNAVLYNQNRQQSRIRLFETGLCFIPDEKCEFGVRQELMLSGIITGNLYEDHWQLPKKSVDYYDLKGDLEAIFSLLGCDEQVQFNRAELPALHPGQSAAINLNEEVIGYLGVLHPEIEKKLSLNSKTLVFEINLAKINFKKVPVAKDLSKYPSNKRDIAIIVSNTIPAAEIISVCKQAGGEQLVKVNLFDVYQGDNIDVDQKSLAISLILQDKSRTLEEEDITNIVSKCVTALQNRFKALLRE
ncbi:phenylalanine--tRNA ligase subunit beta [Gilliamella sp. B2776]|uniref:phenylalanine--tRNA ligase subunit beta n=1 Tax=unclassified Gilliamella TaxID=2685620 RepID=UPI00226A6609|nr:MULTISPECIES: phenylalanine--tRNA ligase subunit beta [unclassified Gilliamella]MCX8650745.1 phenylalanine--tRNA ligase subunit beta [Gilliamella sp. B2779]MCX8654095.1 phenylalanine--tRNA ligase subunit beta [Gilliamella sp. B2737]MCX8692593.1 phenylalanine--tRNA ligase subunit beta [Gilliamella sp. B2776]MCX8703770.1 phenylalanine--tRNA ligase subunit beta [Gilliamella sp. B2781]WDM18593.1 phenylalanine--tRNA ligase subunit beta [Gilliamella sp. B3022]